jgi:hypothetical protein
MYFDHVRCPACNSQFNPEKLDVQSGVARCPSCNTQIGVAGLFGVGDAFVGVGDDEGIGLTLEDAIEAQPRPGSQPVEAPTPGRDERESGGQSHALNLLDQIRKDRS